MKENLLLNKVKDTTLTFLKDEDVKVILFGSRAREDNSIYSDVDVGIVPKSKNFDKKKVTLLRERLEEINVPYKIELVDFSFVSPKFKKEALKKAVIWKD